MYIYTTQYIIIYINNKYNINICYFKGHNNIYKIIKYTNL